jgi:hypothetical protein
MKKLYFILTLLLPLVATAQNELKYGINAGLTLSDIRGNEYADEAKYCFNYLAGVSVEIPISEKLSFLTSLNFEKKSYTRKRNIVPQAPIPNPDIKTGIVRYTSTLNYISLPVNLKVYLGSKKNFYLTGGVFVAYMVDAKLKIGGEKSDVDIYESYKTLDRGINLGLGTRIKLTERQNLNIEIRDNLGIENLKIDNYPDAFDMKTNSINLIANWQFDL